MAQILNTLNEMIKNKYQVFDPQNNDHLIAYWMLTYEGKQHPEFRFHLEEGYLDIPTMMKTKISEEYLRGVFGKNLNLNVRN